MSLRSFSAPNWTPTATADTTALANATYQALAGGSASQILRVKEVMITGLAVASTPNNMVLARSSTIATTPTAITTPNTDGPVNNAATGLSTAPLAYTAAAAGSQRSSLASLARLNLGMNAFGGIVRWQAGPDQEWWIVGAGASVESVLSAVSLGGGAVSSHITYEPL